MAPSAFSSGRVGAVSITGLIEAQQQLARTNAGIAENSSGMRLMLNLGAGMVHRYLISLGKERPPVGLTGVLPVITGRLKNSFFWGTRNQGGPVGFVATNLAYAAPVEKRRGFLGKTVKDMEQPINKLFTGYVASVTRE